MSNPTGQCKGCNCKSKTECLKCYCICMINKAVCGPECKCNSEACKNTPDHPEERLEAIAKILISREKAFDEKHFKGCKCEKSAC